MLTAPSSGPRQDPHTPWRGRCSAGMRLCHGRVRIWARALYMISGVTARPTSAGASAAVNQVTQGDAMATPSSDASFMHSRFCAAAVRKSADECTLPWNCACTRNLPRRPALGVPASRPSFFFFFFSPSPHCCTQLPDEVGLHLQGGACCTAQMHGAATSMKHTGPCPLTHTRW